MDADRQNLTGVPFFKMTGSGNDFVFLDGRVERHRALETEDAIRRLCARGKGVGADGVVWLMPGESSGTLYRMRYRNADGSLADMCGNAALCSVRLAFKLGFVPGGRREFHFDTDAGVMVGRLRGDGLPEITLQPVRDLRASAPVKPAESELRAGSANTGVPHLVVEVEDADRADVIGRGRDLRRHAAFAPAGTNVNFVSRADGSAWRMRTYERGVEDETLACGTGAVACATLLREWGLSGSQVSIATSSGNTLQVTLTGRPEAPTPSLAGEGRLVFEGVAADL